MTSVNGHLTEVLAAGRKLHNDLLLDTVVVTRVTGRTLNTATATYTDTTTQIYSGPARVKRHVAAPTVAGDVSRPVIDTVLELPWDATGSAALRASDRATITASTDTALVGKTLTVVGPEHGTTSTVRRYAVEEATP